MIQRHISFWTSRLLVATCLISTVSCSQIPVRNPFEGRKEPKLGALPEIAQFDEAGSASLQSQWSTHPVGKQQRFTKLTPEVTDNIIFAADKSGQVVAVSRDSGKKLWQTKCRHALTAGPTLIEQSLIVATQDAMIMALDPQSGKKRWETKVPSEVLSPPTGQQGMVLVHAIDGSLTAIDLLQGHTVWQVEQDVPALTLHYSSAPVVVGDLVLAGFSTGKLLAVNLHSGLVEWDRTIAVGRGRSEIQRMVDITADPLVSDDTVYVITYKGKLASVDIPTGALNWERDISAYQNMAMDDERLYITDINHDILAVEKSSGATLWKQSDLANRYVTGPCVVQNRVVVADRGGCLHVLSGENGHIIGRTALKGKFYQNPLSLGDEVLVSNHRGKMTVLAVEQG